MAVPPTIPAGVRAELFLFPALKLDHWFTAVRTETVSGVGWHDFLRAAFGLRIQSVSTAESFDRIFRDAQRIRDFRIAPSSFS